MWTLNLSFQVLYVLCIFYGVLSDARYLVIPNWVSAVLVVSFLPYGLLFWPDFDLLSHLIIAVIVLCFSFVLYKLNWIGGGDLKLLTAVSLWMGPAHIASFIMLTTLLGALLSLFVIAVRWAANVHRSLSSEKLPTIVRRWLDEGVCPYGIAIGVAALAMVSSVFT